MSEEKKRLGKVFLNGVITENPTFRLVLGTCPTLAVTTCALNGLGMGAAATFVLIGSNAAISMLRKFIPDQVRIPAFIVIICTFVTMVQLLMQAYLPDLYESLGIFIPLIVVNCIILARAESFASKNPVLDSALDGLFMGIGFTCSLTLMGLFREVLGAGTFFGVKLWDFKIAFFSSSAGAFFTYGLFIAVFNLIMAKVHKNAKQRAYKLSLIHI